MGSINECMAQIGKDLGCVPNDLTGESKFDKFGKKNRCWAIYSEIQHKGNTSFTVTYGDFKYESKYIWKSWEGSIETKSFIKEVEKARKEQLEILRVIQEKHLKEKRIKWKERLDSSSEIGECKYLLDKGIVSLHGAKMQRGQLLIPVYDFTELNGLQVITSTEKKFSSSTKKKGSFFVLNNISNPDVIYFGEGFATCCSIQEATKAMVVCCFDLGNLRPVLESFRERYNCKFVLCADNDQWKDSLKNPGKDQAINLVSSIDNLSYVYPIFTKVETKPTDFNDLHCLDGIQEVKDQILGKKHKNEADEAYWNDRIRGGFSSVGQKGGIIRNCKELRDFFDYKYKYITDDITKEIYSYENGHYQRYSDIKIKAFAQKYYSPVLEKEEQACEFVSILKRHNLSSIEHEKTLSPDKGLINFKNCVYDYLNDKIMENGHEYKFFYVIPHNYNPNAPEPKTWNALLNNLMVNRPNLIEVIEQYIAYMLSGMEYTYNYALIFKGEGKNGKTTLEKAIMDILGKVNCSSAMISRIGSDKYASSSLENKLANFSDEEPPKLVFKDTGNFKAITGNSALSLERKYGHPKSGVLRAKIVMSYNEMPNITDFSKGMIRRLLIVPFDLNLDSRPEKMIKNVNQKIASEVEGIISRIIPKIKTVIKNNGFNKTSEMKTEVSNLLVDNNSFDVWFNSTVEIIEDQSQLLIVDKLYEMFLEEINPRLTRDKFGKMLSSLCRKRGIEKRKGMICGIRKVVIYGVVLKELPNINL